MMRNLITYLFFFFFNDTATTEIYTLSLHDALPISVANGRRFPFGNDPKSKVRVIVKRQHGGKIGRIRNEAVVRGGHGKDRKSTRLNSSHLVISYAVFCLKKKKTQLNNFASTTKCLS